MCLREESEPHTYDSSGILAYFNPRFREGSDAPHIINKHLADISIHASAKEATHTIKAMASASSISIHASAKEATPCGSAAHRFHPNFNPRFREGSDRPLPKVLFNPFQFQSTLPRRKRLKNHETYICFLHFNPRFREGSDYLCC